MHLVGSHTLMVHRACVRPASIGIAHVDITVINIVWRNILFCIRRNWPASAAAFASPLLPDEPASAASTLPLAEGKGCRQEKRSQFRHFHHGAPVLIVTLDNILQQCILFSGERFRTPELCQDGIAYKYLKTVVTSKKLRPDLIFRYFVAYFRRIPRNYLREV